ncbi:UDP-forming cellulose synthase catalytic subunit [Neisseriaceae bacterium TC5R-5]|nr:UDP-forming cellulose synthase catalytic subunit [Neisseriaceae bacterium TC5R-5]
MNARFWQNHAYRYGCLHPADKASLGLLLLGLLLRPPLLGWAAWGRAVQRLFPHIDFYQLKLSDLVRIPLQCLWLLLRRPAAERDDTSSTHYLLRGWQAICKGWQGCSVYLQTHIPWRLDRQRLQQAAEQLLEHRYWHKRWLSRLAYALALLLMLVCITTPFNEWAQGLFVLVLLLVALGITRLEGPVPTLVLMVFSVVVSTRYLWWRLTSTINDDGWVNLLAGILLLLAELYAWLILLLGFFQASWGLQRQVSPLPTEQDSWPTVDVLIPIYNEPLRILRPTVLAALSLEWPQSKLRVYVLDDGQREEIRLFVEQTGAHYLTREQHLHAKAGNINHALGKTTGEFVAIFDCDHIPVRSFLQVTMGGLIHDAKLALVQTPHHFFSADPFERNLNGVQQVPNEGELFYGRVQDGNDLWNAAFFCGSCAVLRRSALLAVGGIATDTVTEDAHTSLRLHRAGYRSAYLKVIQAAGLATESLSIHIGQRVRWARGMAQIFRSDNPLRGKGLSWAQRLCYGNAMLHFLYGLPRLIFLCAPQAFLLFHAYTIYAPALGLVLYLLPHMLFSVLTNSRMHGRYRRSFWGEIYETVLAWHITIPTTMALLFPRLGKFNVTAKGGLVNSSHFDWGVTKPYLLLLLFNLLGLAVGLYRLGFGPSNEVGTLLVNMIWTVYNILLLGVALGVAREVRQLRISHRISAHLPVTLHLPDGRAYPCMTLDYSEGGMALEAPVAIPTKADSPLSVSLQAAGQHFSLPGRVVFAKGKRVSLRFNHLSLAQEMALVQCTFGRADAWLGPQERPPEHTPLHGAQDVVRLGSRGLLQAVQSLGPQFTWLASTLLWLASLLPRQPLPVPEQSA